MSVCLPFIFKFILPRAIAASAHVCSRSCWVNEVEEWSCWGDGTKIMFLCDVNGLLFLNFHPISLRFRLTHWTTLVEL